MMNTPDGNRLIVVVQVDCYEIQRNQLNVTVVAEEAYSMAQDMMSERARRREVRK